MSAQPVNYVVVTEPAEGGPVVFYAGATQDEAWGLRDGSREGRKFWRGEVLPNGFEVAFCAATQAGLDYVWEMWSCPDVEGEE